MKTCFLILKSFLIILNLKWLFLKLISYGLSLINVVSDLLLRFMLILIAVPLAVSSLSILLIRYVSVFTNVQTVLIVMIIFFLCWTATLVARCWLVKSRMIKNVRFSAGYDSNKNTCISFFTRHNIIIIFHKFRETLKIFLTILKKNYYKSDRLN